jgi:hypothetical protein
VADELTKRGYNQAFFTKLFVLAEWDEDQGANGGSDQWRGADKAIRTTTH